MTPTQRSPLAESLSLAGGLPVRLLRRQGPAILSARLAIRGGSSSDPEGGRGAHQLLAGLMTRGCGDLDAEALADLVEGAGAGLRAEALEDALVIGLKCAAADAASLLPLLLAMVRQPQLSPDQLDLERQLNLQTLQRQREDPFQLAHDQLRHSLYGAGPYGHDPLGVEPDLESLSADDLQPLVANLGRSGAVLVLSGEIPDDLSELLEAGLGGEPWPTVLQSAAAWSTRPGAAPATRLAQQEQDTEQLVLMLGSATLPLGHPDAVALRLLQAHLGLGMSSRLFVTMREERGLAYDVGVHLPARCGAAPFVMHLSTSADRAEEATDCLLQEWQRVRQQPLDPTELALALAKYRGQDAMGRQTCSQLAERLALVLSHGLPSNHVERCLEQALQLSAEAIRQAADTWLGQPALSLVGPAPALAAATRAWHGHALSGLG
ncbi:MAG: pitrilysin family protein [Cyanobacteria bacterium]|nr:pitrilysin family protein [Cyanobacteriota bacterium]